MRDFEKVFAPVRRSADGYDGDPGLRIMSSVQRFISHKKLPGEGLAEPHKACVRAMLPKGRNKQERQKCTIGYE